VRIRADDSIPGQYQPLFRQQAMLNTHLADVVIHHALFHRKIAHYLDLLGRDDVLIGDKMVGDHDDFLGVKHFLYPDALELTDSDGSSNIIREDKVRFQIDKLSRADGLFSAVGGDDFFY